MLIASFRKLKEKELATLDYSGTFFGQALPKFHRTARTDLGYPSKKVIREISINSIYDAIIQLQLDKRLRQYQVKGSDRAIKIKVNEEAEKISFSIISEVDRAEIYNPVITVDVRG